MLDELRKTIVEKLIDWAYPNLKWWGAELKKNYPPEFKITEHAEKRIESRVNQFYSDRKKLKLTVKAWYNGKDVTEEAVNKGLDHGEGRIYKELGNHIYIYSTDKPRDEGFKHATQKTLVTVIYSNFLWSKESRYDYTVEDLVNKYNK